MLIIGLTGSIGMGKSTVAGRFRAHGIGVIDADAEVHRLYAGEAVAPIEAAFPGTTANGVVDRTKLSAALMAEPSRFRLLEAIVHPLVQASERRFLLDEFQRGARMAVLEVPLLFETGADARVDVTVVVSAPPHIQRERVLERPGMTPEKLVAILTRQLPDHEKRSRADFIVDTEGSIADSEAQVDAIVAQLEGQDGTAFQTYWS